MANALITPSIIAKEALMQLENNLVMGNLVHRDYKREFVKIGDTVSIRRPVKFDVTDGATLTIEPGELQCEFSGDSCQIDDDCDPGALVVARGAKVQALGT